MKLGRWTFACVGVVGLLLGLTGEARADGWVAYRPVQTAYYYPDPCHDAYVYTPYRAAYYAPAYPARSYYAPSVSYYTPSYYAPSYSYYTPSYSYYAPSPVLGRRSYYVAPAYDRYGQPYVSLRPSYAVWGW